MGIIRKSAAAAALLYLITLSAVICWAYLWPETKPTDVARADAILCLGAGMEGDGTLHRSSQARVETCVELFHASRATYVIFSGGTGVTGGPSAAAQMAAYGHSLGLPVSAARIEPRAQSTLQNALFSLPMLSEADRVIVVTEAFHLPRSAASIGWAAWELGQEQPQISLVMSAPVVPDPQFGRPTWIIFAREALALWFNLARALAYSTFPFSTEDWLY